MAQAWMTITSGTLYIALPQVMLQVWHDLEGKLNKTSTFRAK